MADNLSLLEKIAELRQKIVELENKTVELTEEEEDLLRESESTLQKLVKIQQNRLKLALGTKQAELELNKTISSQKSDLSSISTIYKGLTSSQTQSLNVTQRTLSSVQQSLLADETKKQILNSTLSGVTDLQGLQQKIAETGPEDLEVQQSIRDSYNAQLNELKENIVSKQAIGELTEQEATALLKILDTQKESLSIAEKYATVSGDTKEFLQSQIDAYKGIEKTIRGVLNTAKVLSSSVGGVVGIALIGAGTVGKKLLETSRQLGGNLMSMQNISTTIFGTVFDDAVGATKALSKEFGGLNDVSLKTQLNTNVISTNLGISTGEAASLIGNFSRLNDGSTSVAQDMIATTKELALQNGLVPSDVMADVASNAEAFALYGKDGGKNIAQAAIAAGKLGVGMDKLTGITDNLLDFETSINAELELGAMLGKNINLDRARALAYEGNIGGAVQETLASLGGIEEFNKMDYFSKKKAAELLGLSVDEFQKMAANADKLNEDGTIQVSQYEQNVELLKSMGSQALTLVQSLGTGVIALGQMGGGLKSLKGTLGSVTEGFKSIFGKDALSQARKTFSDKQIASGFGGKKAKDMLASKMGTDTPSKMPDVKSQAKMSSKVPQTSVTDKVNETTGGKGGKGMNVNNILKGAAAILILSAALYVAAKAFQEFGSVTWPAVGMGITALAGMAAIAYILGKAQGEMIKGAVAVAILGAALIPFAFAMNLISGLDIGAVLAAAGGLVIFSAAVFGLGALMMSGVGALVFGAGLVALTGLGVTMAVLGAGLLVAAAGFQAIGSSLSGVLSTISQLGGIVGGIVQYVVPIMGLSLAMYSLAASLAVLGVAGLVALAGVAAFTILGNAMGVITPNAQTSLPIIQQLVGYVVPMSALSVAVLGLAASLGLVGIAGVAALPGILAVNLLGIGMMMIANAFQITTGALSSILPAIASVGTTIGAVVQYITPITMLSLALMGLAGALTAVGAAGLLALPALLGVAAVGAVALGVGELMGGGETETKSESSQALLEEIKGLRNDLNSGKVAVYMDGQKVTASVSKVVDRIGSNSYAI
jgi:hypothetical protein